MKIRAFLVLLVIMLAALANAQSGRQRPIDPNAPRPTPEPVVVDKDALKDVDEDDVIKFSTDLVSLPVSVFDKKGRYIFDMRRDEFQLFEDGKEQKIEFFGSTDQPFTVVLMLDISLSTKFQMKDIRRAAVAFIDQLRPQDKMMIVAFAEDVYVLSEFTADREALKRSVQSTRFLQGTSLYDAMDFVVGQRLATERGRKAIVLFSDGVDTTSQDGTLEGNLDAAIQELDSLIYTINYDTFADIKRMDRENDNEMPQQDASQPPLPSPVKISPDSERTSSADTAGKSYEDAKIPGLTGKDYKRAAFYLEMLSELTGGRFDKAETLYDLGGAFSKIAQELRQQYSIGYYPPDDGNTTKARRIRVKVTRPKMVVKTRDTYTLGEKRTEPENDGKKPALKTRN